MTSKCYFGKMNSTLGSVVPLAMFYRGVLFVTGDWRMILFNIRDHEKGINVMQ